MSGRVHVPLVLLCVVSLTACGGGGSSASDVVSNVADVDPLGDDAPSASPFPPPRPPVDPVSSVEEIESRMTSVLAAYDELMVEVLRQIDDLYQTIGSGVEPSTDPDVLRRDAELYDRLASGYCLTDRATNGDLVAISNAGCYSAPLAFRHPVYDDVLVYVTRYDRSRGYGGFSEVRISTNEAEFILPRTLIVCTDDDVGNCNRARDDDATHLGVTMDVPDGIVGEIDQCQLQFSPFEFGTARIGTNVNECSGLLGDALTVLQRLNAR